IAAFVAQYTGKRATGTNANPEETLIKVACGCVARCGRNAAVTRIGASRLVAISICRCSSSRADSGLKFMCICTPALLMTQFNAGQSATTLCATSLIDSALVTSITYDASPG